MENSELYKSIEKIVEIKTKERLEQLEEKLAYLEMTNAELNDEIFRQQQEIDTLLKGHKSLLDRLEAVQDAAEGGLHQGGSQQIEKPPHY